MHIKHKAVFVFCFLTVLSAFTGCEDIKFIEKVSETTPASDIGPADPVLESTSDGDDWKTQTLATSSITLPPVTTVPSAVEYSDPTSSRISASFIESTSEPSEISEISTTSESVTDFDDSYFVEIHPKDIEFTKTTNLYKSSTDTEPFKIRPGFTATITGRSIDGKWDVIDFSGNTFLAISDNDYYEIVVETEATTTERIATTVATTVSEEITTTTTTSATTVTTTTTPPTTTTTAIPTTITTVPTTTTTIRTTTTPPATAVTTRPPVTTAPTNTVTSKKQVVGNVGGIEFPQDVSKTSTVFGIIFVNMDIQIYLVNDVDVSSGPGVPNKSNGYIDLGMFEAGTEMKCLGISYDGWLRVRLPNGKIGFIYETDASAL